MRRSEIISSIFIPNEILAKKTITDFCSPIYLTDAQTIYNRVQVMKNILGENNWLFYALKANYNPAIISLLKEYGIDGIDAVSLYEVILAKRLGFSTNKIMFTGNNVSTEEMLAIDNEGIIMNIGSISELERFLSNTKKKNKQFSLRINPDVGEGEFKGIITGGQDSKFGLLAHDIPMAKTIIEKYNAELIGIHCHIGSGIYKMDQFHIALNFMREIARKLLPTQFINLGGGIGVRYKNDDNTIDIDNFKHTIKNFINTLFTDIGKKLRIIMEPGKFLTAESTALLTTVVNIKHNSEDNIFVGIDTGMNHLLRPALYGAKHEIVNLSNPEGKKCTVNIVGNICESTDIFSQKISIQKPREGDILAILTTGAYGASMSSLYNMRPYAKEAILFADDKLKLIRKHVSIDTMLQGCGIEL